MNTVVVKKVALETYGLEFNPNACHLGRSRSCYNPEPNKVFYEWIEQTETKKKPSVCVCV